MAFGDPRRVMHNGFPHWEFADGTLLPVIAGGSDEPNPDDKKDSPGDLGEAGKKALQAERQRANEAEKARKAAEQKVSELEERLTKLEADAMSDQEKAIAKARKEAEDEARKDERAKWANTIRAAKAEVAAAGKLANPKLATKLIDLSSIEVSDDGVVDDKALTKAIDALLESEPYLATGAGGKPPGSADGGVRPPANKPETTPGIGTLQQAYANSSKAT